MRTLPLMGAADRAAFNIAVRQFMTAGPNGGPVRYRHRGRGFKGTDCVGLPFYALLMIGVDAGDSPDYSPRPDGVTLRQALVERLGEPIPMSTARAGDIVLMRWHATKEATWFNHVGVLTALPYPVDSSHPLEKFAVMHAFATNKTVIEHRIAPPWTRRIAEVYSLTGRRA